jgi:hypothetical protein
MRFALTFVIVALCACALMPVQTAGAEEVSATDAAEQADAGPLAVSPPSVIAVPETPPIAATMPPATPAASSWSDLGWKVAEWVVNGLCALLGFAIILFGRWLAGKTANEKIRHIINQAVDAASTAVQSVQQTYVDALIKGGGKLTPEQQAEALSKALTACKTILGSKGLDTLQSALALGQSDLETWLTHHLEEAVAQVKS